MLVGLVRVVLRAMYFLLVKHKLITLCVRETTAAYLDPVTNSTFISPPQSKVEFRYKRLEEVFFLLAETVLTQCRHAQVSSVDKSRSLG